MRSAAASRMASALHPASRGCSSHGAQRPDLRGAEGWGNIVKRMVAPSVGADYEVTLPVTRNGRQNSPVPGPIQATEIHNIY